MVLLQYLEDSGSVTSHAHRKQIYDKATRRQIRVDSVGLQHRPAVVAPGRYSLMMAHQWNTEHQSLGVLWQTALSSLAGTGNRYITWSPVQPVRERLVQRCETTGQATAVLVGDPCHRRFAEVKADEATVLAHQACRKGIRTLHAWARA